MSLFDGGQAGCNPHWPSQSVQSGNVNTGHDLNGTTSYCAVSAISAQLSYMLCSPQHQRFSLRAACPCEVSVSMRTSDSEVRGYFYTPW